MGATLLAVSLAVRVAVWVPPWNGAALTSLQLNAGAVAESNPVWYSWNADGTIAKNWNAENDAWRAAMTSTRMVPTIQNVVKGSFDRDGVERMLATATTREAHAEAIAQLVEVNAFDGIDVDYERIPASARANFTAFIATLAQKLHASDKTLSVTVPANPNTLDWPALGALADSVKIMAYDYSWSASTPGPIAPLDWLDKVASQAESAIPAEKIMIGLPFYGYSWTNGTGRGVSYAEAMQLSQGATIQHDANGEATFTVGATTVFFQDAESYRRKVEMLRQKHPQIGGFAHWSIGQEDPAVWNVIGANSTSGATPPPSPQPGRRRAAGR